MIFSWTEKLDPFKHFNFSGPQVSPSSLANKGPDSLKVLWKPCEYFYAEIFHCWNYWGYGCYCRVLICNTFKNVAGVDKCLTLSIALFDYTLPSERTTEWTKEVIVPNTPVSPSTFTSQVTTKLALGSFWVFPRHHEFLCQDHQSPVQAHHPCRLQQQPTPSGNGLPSSCTFASYFHIFIIKVEFCVLGFLLSSFAMRCKLARTLYCHPKVLFY